MARAITQAQFNKHIRDGRRRFLELTEKSDKDLATMYLRSAKDVKAGLVDLDGKGAMFQKHILNTIMSEAAILSNQFEGKMHKNLVQAANLGSEADKAIARMLDKEMSDRGISIGMKRVLWGVPTEAVKAVYARTWKDGLQLSNRVWNLNKTTERGLKQIIQSHITRGVAASDPMTITRLEKLLDPTRRGIRTKLHGRNVSYDAARLLRTERTIAFRDAQQKSAMRNPAAIGIKWLLSNRHPEYDICDEHAQHDEGLGTGVFASENLPLSTHPQ